MFGLKYVRVMGLEGKLIDFFVKYGVFSLRGFGSARFIIVVVLMRP